MTQRYLGGIITANPVEPSENFSDSAASGMWTMQEALSFSKAGDWPDPTSINPSKFIENVFSTFAYTGNGSTQSINNGIDLSGEGGLVWIKSRANSNFSMIFDTERGATKRIIPSETDAEGTSSTSVTSFNSNGFSLGSLSDVNLNNQSTISWTFREQPKFFDIVTYTGDGSSARQISHNLGSVPGMIIIKAYDTSGENWTVYHRGVDSTSPENYGLTLNSTAARADESGFFNDTAPTSSVFTVGTNLNSGFGGGMNFVAYLFAHNDGDGGFGATGDQDIIKCGSYTGNGSTQAITLGFEPQWVMTKAASRTSQWVILDSIRGIVSKGAVEDDKILYANISDAEATAELLELTANGFKLTAANGATNNNSETYIYMAIRKGLMNPTVGTQVFAAHKETSATLNDDPKFVQTSGFPVDFVINKKLESGGAWWSGIRKTNTRVQLESNAAESSVATTHEFDNMTGVGVAGLTGSTNFMGYMFRTADGFFDIVTYTGTGDTPTNVSHNLGVTPELIIVKNRSNAESWAVFNSTIGKTKQGFINTNDAFGTEDTADQAGGVWGDHTSSIIQVGTNGRVGTSSQIYVAFLFATLAGVSKVGTYSGTGSDVDVDCGFTSGARFVLAKRTDSSGSWHIWDSTNGIIAGNDPYMQTDNTGAQVTNTDYIDPLSSGFTITSNAGNDLNASGGSYVFLAIA